MDRTDVPPVLRLMQKHGLEFELDPGSASYFLSKVELMPGDDESLARWRKHLFLALGHVASDAAEYFHLPRERTLIVGSRIYV
jgi:KUP system potassium uptake protein